MKYLPKILKRIVPLRFRSLIGEKYRIHQRGKGQLLTDSAEIMATAFRLSLNSNGYESDLNELEDFDILVLCTSNDFNILEKNISHIIAISSKKMKKINIVVNKDKEKLNEISINRGWKNVEVFDESIFSREIKFLEGDINRFHPNRRSWILQQCLKTIFVANAQIPTLIIDSDTFIKDKIEPIGDGTQILFAGNDFHYPYSRHLMKFRGGSAIGISFVHHVQLQIPEMVREIYGQDFLVGIRRWLKTGVAVAEFSSVSEFQTYGDFIMQNYPEKVKLKFHIHHFVDARAFNAEIKEGRSQSLDFHLKNCECDFVTLENKHLV